MALQKIFMGAALLALSGCGVVYTAPYVSDGKPFGSAYGTDYKVKVVQLTYESAAAANLEPYVPARLPAAFQPGAADKLAASIDTPNLAPVPSVRGALPTPGPMPQAEDLPPQGRPEPYKIGVGDSLLLGVNMPGTTTDLPGLLAAVSKRQDYMVQDDGAIAVPDAGRIRVAGMTMQDAESAIFRALAAAGIDPSFSLEITKFNSQSVTVGGLVGGPKIIPVTLKALRLKDAITAAGGISTSALPKTTVIELTRGNHTYRMRLGHYLSSPSLQATVLQSGDSIYVDPTYQEGAASTYFNQQMSLRAAQRSDYSWQREGERLARSKLSTERALFKERLSLGAIQRNFVYVTGETRTGRILMPFESKMYLADALFGEKTGGFNIRSADYAGIYVLRGMTAPEQNGGVTAYHLDSANMVNMLVATKFELRPDDVVFVAEQPITSWNRVVSQIMPNLFLPNRLSNATSNL